MSVLDYRGGKIAFDVEGKGPALILLHGFLENRSIWKDYSKALSKSHRVISIDLPGHGETSNFGYCHTMEFMAKCVMAVLRHLKIRKFHIVGHSLGGYVAMAIAEEHPDNIRGLCMFHSTADSDSTKKKAERLKVIKVVQKNKELFVKTVIPNLFNTEKKGFKKDITQLVKMANSMSVQGIIAAVEGMRIRNNREIVMRFTPYPVLYLIGKKDNILPWKKLVEESQLAETSEFLVMEEVGHMGFIEAPDQCLNSIRKFLRKKVRA